MNQIQYSQGMETKPDSGGHEFKVQCSTFNVGDTQQEQDPPFLESARPHMASVRSCSEGKPVEGVDRSDARPISRTAAFRTSCS